MEDRFDVTFPADVADRVGTVGELLAMARQLAGEKGNSA